MPVTVRFLEQDRQSAATVAGWLAEFLAAARTSLHLAIYDFRLSDAVAAPIVTALRDRVAAGVDVRIVYDAGKQDLRYPKAGGDPAPPGTAQFVARLGLRVPPKPITGGNPVQPKLMHQKYVVRDGQTPGAAVWTGSTNFTEDSWTLMENNILEIDSPELCRLYENDFTELWDRGDIDTTGLHDTGTATVGGASVHVAFAPGQGRFIDHEVAQRIAQARRRIKLGSMIITSGTILGALADALNHRQVTEFNGVFDRTQMEGVFDQWKNTPREWKIDAFRHIAAPLSGKRSTPYTPGGRHDFMHAKIMVLDDTVVTGSYNFSHSATENAENILMIRDAVLADRYGEYLDRLAARYRA